MVNGTGQLVIVNGGSSVGKTRVEAEFYTTETYEDNGLPYFIVHPGPLLDEVMYARYRAIKAYLDHGLNVISDDVLWKREWLEDAVRLLADYHVVFVGARISDAEGATGRSCGATATRAGIAGRSARSTSTRSTTRRSTPLTTRPKPRRPRSSASWRAG